MSVSKSATQITFSAANSISISGDSQATSDAMSLSNTSVAAQLTVKADHDSTAVSGDTVDFYLLFSTGDPDGGSADEYDTAGHGLHIAVLDLNIEDPAQKTVDIPVSAKGFKVYVDNNSSSNAVTCSAEIYETLVT
jgi:hypothetical protein